MTRGVWIIEGPLYTDQLKQAMYMYIEDRLVLEISLGLTHRLLVVQLDLLKYMAAHYGQLTLH